MNPWAEKTGRWPDGRFWIHDDLYINGPDILSFLKCIEIIQLYQGFALRTKPKRADYLVRQLVLQKKSQSKMGGCTIRKKKLLS